MFEGQLTACPGGIRAGLGGRECRAEAGWKRSTVSDFGLQTVWHVDIEPRLGAQTKRGRGQLYASSLLGKMQHLGKERAQRGLSPVVWGLESELARSSRMWSLHLHYGEQRDCCSHFLPGKGWEKVALGMRLSRDGLHWPGSGHLQRESPWPSDLLPGGGKRTPHPISCCPFKQLLGSRVFIRKPSAGSTVWLTVPECVRLAHGTWCTLSFCQEVLVRWW